MKKLIILSLYLLTNKSFCQVSISGEVINATELNEVSITYYNNNIEGTEVSAGKTKLNEKGKFTMSFKLDKPHTATLKIGNQHTDMFLVPNDKIQITVDYKSFDSTIVYKGIGGADNNYMAADLLAGFNIKANYYSVFTDADKYKLYEDSLERANNLFLKTHDNPEFTSAFRNYITITTKYRFINSRWMFKVIRDKVTQKFSERELPENYFDFLKTIDLNEQTQSDNSSYTIALMRYLTEYNDIKTEKEIPDSLPVLQKKEMRITKNYNYRKSIFKDKVLDYQLTAYMKKNIGLVSADTKFAEALMKDYKTVCRNSEYISIIDKVYEQANKLVKGNDAPDFTLINKEGKQVSLSSFKGKIVYIDFWATWCMPCIDAMNRSQELTEKFKDRNDIVFLYVNVRDDMVKWKGYLVKEKTEGIHLFADKEQSEKLYHVYNFVGIPHYTLIDRNGKIINPNAESPEKVEAKILEASK